MSIVELTEEQEEEIELGEYQQERGKPMPNVTHGSVQANLTGTFYAQLKEDYRLATETAFEFADATVLTPDIAVLAKRSLDWSREPARCRDLPVTVVEILSPSQGYRTAVAKKDAYFANGVQTLWEVNPALKLIAIHRTGNDDPQIILHGEAKDPVTGLTARLEEIFS